MGITIKSPNMAIKMGYGAFLMLRETAAALAGDDIAEFYGKMRISAGYTSVSDWEIYNRHVKKFFKQNGLPRGLYDFLYLPDCDRRLSVSSCRQLYEIIKNSDGEKDIYGRIEPAGNAKMKDFICLLEDCIKNRKPMKWS